MQLDNPEHLQPKNSSSPLLEMDHSHPAHVRNVHVFQFPRFNKHFNKFILYNWLRMIKAWSLFAAFRHNSDLQFSRSKNLQSSLGKVAEKKIRKKCGLLPNPLRPPGLVLYRWKKFTPIFLLKNASILTETNFTPKKKFTKKNY